MLAWPLPPLYHSKQCHLLATRLPQTQPETADAALNDPARFAEILRQINQNQQRLNASAEAEMARLQADPYNLDAQRKIEEAIQQQAVMENFQHALEYSPESFGRVTML